MTHRQELIINLTVAARRAGLSGTEDDFSVQVAEMMSEAGWNGELASRVVGEDDRKFKSIVNAIRRELVQDTPQSIFEASRSRLYPGPAL